MLKKKGKIEFFKKSRYNSLQSWVRLKQKSKLSKMRTNIWW